MLGFVAADGTAWAHPHRILNFHEIVNTEFAGEPVAITYCPLCGSGLVFDRRINDLRHEGVLTFDNTSALYENDMVMVDEETNTYWWQVGGRGIVGNLTGTSLQLLPSMTTTWASWLELYPNTMVLSDDQGRDRPYDSDPFQNYGTRLDAGQTPFPTSPEAFADERLAPSTRVIGFEVNGTPAAVAVLANQPTVVAINADQVVFLDGRGGGGLFSTLVDGSPASFEADADSGGFVDDVTRSTWNAAGVATNGPAVGQSLTALAEQHRLLVRLGVNTRRSDHRALRPHVRRLVCTPLGCTHYWRLQYDPVMTKSQGRSLAKLLGTYHNVTYYARELTVFRDRGIEGFWNSYMAFRAAPMGRVNADVVTATFYNFAPSMVAAALPAAWTHVTPAEAIRLRDEAIETALNGVYESSFADNMADIASTIAGAMADLPAAGRPLFGAYRALPMPESPVMRLWYATTLWREYRGDGHNIALATAGIDGIECHVLLAGRGIASRQVIEKIRGWDGAAWTAAHHRLRGRGLIDEDGKLTEAGAEFRRQIEADTDRLAQPALDEVGEVRASEIVDQLTPIVAMLVESGIVPDRWPPPPDKRLGAD